MGIRCWCPNGHKLNIKAFQAGKRGICPYCGARFTIPLESIRKPGMGDRLPEPREHSVHEGPVTIPPAGGTAPVSGSAPLPSSGPLPSSAPLPAPEPTPFLAAPTPLGPLPTGEPPAWTPSVGGVPSAPIGSVGQSPPSAYEESAPWGAAPTASPSVPMGMESIKAGPEPFGIPDPLAEAPNAVWYVRPPTGGQFGPAPGDVMRNWIDEGRVSPDSLVWREGWRDWQEAGQVFPQLRASSGFTPASSGEPLASRVRSGRKASQTQNLWLLLLLVVAVAVLVGVFIYVAFGPHTNPSGSSPTPPASASTPDAASKK